jgi:hypothetical protein
MFWERLNPVAVKASFKAAALGASRLAKTFRSRRPGRYGQGEGAVR